MSVNGPFIPDSVPTVVVEFMNLRYMRVALVSAGCAVMVPEVVGPVIPYGDGRCGVCGGDVLINLTYSLALYRKAASILNRMARGRERGGDCRVRRVQRIGASVCSRAIIRLLS